MTVDKKIAQRILSETNDARVLGYYTLLKLLDIQNLTDISKLAGISIGQCRTIEKKLINLGLLRVSGVGSNRVVIFPETENKEAIRLLEYYAEEINKELITYSDWYRRQLNIANSLIQEFGYDMSKWMIYYVLHVEKVNMYSLNLINSMLCELVPKYKQFEKNRKRIQEQDSTWESTSIKTQDKNKPKKDVDLTSLLSYGIEI